MTLDDVMALEGRELDAAVAERLGWTRHENMPTVWVDPNRWIRDLPHFSTDWNAAMQVREWAKAGEPTRARLWVEAVSQCETARNRPTSYISFGSDVLLHAEPIDYCRAALLVSP